MINEYDYPSLDVLFGDYAWRSEEALNELDMYQLSEVAKKPLEQLTSLDLEAIRLRRQADPDFPELCAMENLDMLKLYITIEEGRYQLRGFQLRLIQPIHSTGDLIRETLINWKLKMP